MASYTDNPINFKEYVSRMPLIEAYTTVGMQKQAAYNEGYQKIQSEIDRQIGSIDLARPADIEYLNSVVGELSDRLKLFAAADFSNMQLVNSLSGMVKRVSSDPIIRKAISSTAKYKYEQDRIKKDIEAGKYNPNNIKKFHKDASVWLNSTKPGEDFNTTYFSPVDVNAKIRQVAKDVGIDESVVQQLFQTDENGNVIFEYDSKGKPTNPKLNPVMVERHLKGKDAGKILEAIQNALTPADYMQLAIDGEFAYENYSGEDLKNMLISSSETQLTSLNEKIEGLKMSLENERKNGKNNIERQVSLEKQISFYEKQRDKIKTDLQKNINLVDTNPDAVRSSLYTNTYLTSMAHALSFQEESIKFLENPLFKAVLEQNKFNLELRKQKFNEDKFQKEYLLDLMRLEGENKDREIEMIKLGLKYDDKLGRYVSEGVKSGIPTEDLYTNLANQKMDDYQRSVSDLNEIGKRVLFENLKSQYADIRTPGMTDELFLEEVIRKSGIKLFDNDGNLTDSGLKIVTKQLEMWKKDYTNIPLEHRSLYDNYYKALRSTEAKKNLIESMEKEVERMVSMDPELSGHYDKIKSIKPIYVKTPDGNTFELSKDDIIDFSNIINSLRSSGIQVKNLEVVKKAENRLREKYGKDYHKIFSELVTVVPRGTLSTDYVPKQNIKPYVDAVREVNIDRFSKIRAEVYRKYFDVAQPMTYPVLRGEVDKDDFYSKISSVLQSRTNAYSAEELNKLVLKHVTNEQKVFNIEAVPVQSDYGGKKLFLVVKDPDGDKRFEITDDEARFLGVVTPDNPGVPDVVNKLLYSSNTNAAGVLNPSSSWYTEQDFVNYKGTDYRILGADYVKDALEPNRLYLKLYIRDTKNNVDLQPIDLGIPFSLRNPDGSLNQDLDTNIQAINDAVIKALVKKHKQ
ncbi:MAG: hypothetical protein NZZ41_05075 [Candidatus Dojkabacteria bacterium]|nr:hypothetical protein [Candidatus Dojkabacteria bacterium]